MRKARTLILAGCWILWLGCAASSQAGSPQFRQHDLSPESAYSACAAMDVNRDGRLDVVCGGYWYEAPQWNRRFLRDVEMIGNRYDDYSNLPLDVNGDGWLDLVSANYRSQSVYWVEHPGPSLEGWKKHVIDTPGPMETGRLYDIDGDGRMDVLPNGVRFAAWWEVRHSGDGPVWTRHDLPPEVIGHGLGLGDVNGDGRSDLVAPRGWLEAPEDRRGGRWIWRGEFQLDRDCSIPVLVQDVDEDGDADVIWGRGHRTGLYWLEQSADADGRRRWTRHAIDTSWSQPHSILLGDVDNDGREDLIAGKRYLGHDGKDPGEYDPLVIYWYKFDRNARTWRRGDISVGGRAGVGLDPKAVDLDGDGDLDVLVAGRSGLYWLENLLVRSDSSPPSEAKRALPPAACDHANIAVYYDSAGRPQPVTSPADWALRRAQIMAGLQEAMGPLPDPSRRVPLNVETLEESKQDGVIRRKITYSSEPGDRVPAYLLVPESLNGKRAPAMLCLHQTTRIGKDEPAGLGGSPSLHFAKELAERGYVCLAPDYPSFGDYDYDFRRDGRDYASGTMKAIWNNVRAIDLIETLPEVDRDRIGCIGHSLGGHNSLFTAAFDLRIQCVITSCGFTALHDYRNGDLTAWSQDRYMPRIRDRYQNDPDQAPFDFYEVLAAIAPRGVFVNAPLRDANFSVGGVKKVMAADARLYETIQAKGELETAHPDCEHGFPDDVRRRAYEWLDRQLK